MNHVATLFISFQRLSIAFFAKISSSDDKRFLFIIIYATPSDMIFLVAKFRRSCENIYGFLNDVGIKLYTKKVVNGNNSI